MRILALLLFLTMFFGFATKTKAQACYDQSFLDPNANCTFIYEPVCGCDGNTYANQCVAVKYNGITQMRQGPCTCNYSWYNMPPCFSCFNRVELIEYNNNIYIAEWGETEFCTDALSTIYNCDGSVFCIMGGIAGINTCGNLINNYATLNILWSEDAFCNCNYESWYVPPTCEGCIERVEHIAYNGNTYIAYWASNTNCSDALTTIYNCDGSIYCEIGGIAGFNTCGILPYNYTVINTLWDEQTNCNQAIDLALRMTLQPGQATSFNQGDLVTFDITVFNQGANDAALIDIVNYIPQGLLLNDGDWNIVSTNTPNTAMASIIGPIVPLGNETISITLFVEDDSFCSTVNAAEILTSNDIDSYSDTFNNNDITIDNEINNINNDEDDYDIELISINCQNCPPFLELNNSILSSGVYQASAELRSNSKIDTGNIVLFKAGNKITLNNNFSVSSATNFSANIENCNCHLPAPHNLVVDNVDLNAIKLQWSAVVGASVYYIEYSVDRNFANRLYTNNTSIIIPFANGIENEYTVFTGCGTNSAANQGPTINYTRTPDCSTCSPPENIDAYFDSNGDLVISYDGAENANYVNFAFYDEQGNLILEIPYDGTDSLLVTPNNFQEGVFPDVIEVEVAANCGPNGRGFKEQDDFCHRASVIILTSDDDPAKYGRYCGSGGFFNKILCSHVSSAVTMSQFRCMHCDGNAPKTDQDCIEDCVNTCTIGNSANCNCF